MALQKLLDAAELHWKKTEDSADAGILRLSILRDLSYEIHAEKSRVLSSGTSREALILKNLENKIEAFKLGHSSNSILTANLKQLLEAQLPAQAAVSAPFVFPEKLEQVLPREKIDRYDRQWEHAIVEEALYLKWNFWSLKSQVPLAQIEEANHLLRTQLWPQGIVLFAESIGFLPTPPQWSGQWTLVCQNEFVPDQSCVALIEQYFSATEWKLLFSPAKA